MTDDRGPDQQPPGAPAAQPPPGGRLDSVLAAYGGRANLMGILSSTLGFLSIVCCVCTSFGGGGFYFTTLVLAGPAVILGVMHAQQVKRGLATNRNLAYVGIILGAIGLFIALCGGLSTLGTDLHNDIG